MTFEWKILELESENGIPLKAKYHVKHIGLKDSVETEGYWTFSNKTERKPFAESKEAERDRANHWANFLEAVRSGKDQDLHSDIHEGHLSTSLCHLANISYRVGRSIKFANAVLKTL